MNIIPHVPIPQVAIYSLDDPSVAALDLTSEFVLFRIAHTDDWEKFVAMRIVAFDMNRRTVTLERHPKP